MPPGQTFFVAAVFTAALGFTACTYNYYYPDDDETNAQQSTAAYTEYDVPITVPFAGNTYITYPADLTSTKNYIDDDTGRIKSNYDLYYTADPSHKWNPGWIDYNMICSTYFYAGSSGELDLAAMINEVYGTSVIRFTVNGVSYDVTVQGDWDPRNMKDDSDPKMYSVGKFSIDKPGYVKVEIQGILRSFEWSGFGQITALRIGGAAAEHGTNYFVTEEAIEKAGGASSLRGGAAVHLWYTQPEGNVEYFYNEVLVTEENAKNATYYEMNGFNCGYMGIQQLNTGERCVLFSVWSAYKTDNPDEIPEDYKV